MKDNIQNIADLIGALAEDIEEIKKKLDAKDASDKDDAVKRLSVKLEPLIRFTGDNTLANISDIFKSKESIEAYKKSLGDEMIVSLQAYTDANDKDMRKHGVPTSKELLYKILGMLANHVENDKRTIEKAQQKQGFIPGLWQAICPDKALRGIRWLWEKVPDGWCKNPYTWAGIVCTLVFFALFAVSWVQRHEYREENKRLRMVADKHRVTTVMLNELYPELAVTIGAYKGLVDVIGVDSTLAIFNRQVKIVREKEIQTK